MVDDSEPMPQCVIWRGFEVNIVPGAGCSESLCDGDSSRRACVPWRRGERRDRADHFGPKSNPERA